MKRLAIWNRLQFAFWNTCIDEYLSHSEGSLEEFLDSLNVRSNVVGVA
jgi:hypothetical protein